MLATSQGLFTTAPTLTPATADSLPRSEVPSNLIIKKVSPKIWLPFLTFAWGIITIGIGFMRDYKDFMILRAVLGIFEGGLFPGIVLYLSSMYTRGELAVRIGVFYTGGSLSGAFGGLLARGLSAIGPRGGLEGWRWIFIMEGVIVGLLVHMAGLGSNAVLTYFRRPLLPLLLTLSCRIPFMKPSFSAERNASGQWIDSNRMKEDDSGMRENSATRGR